MNYSDVPLLMTSRYHFL